MTIHETVSARRAAEICGFRSVAMLDYLERSGVFVRSTSKEKRRGRGRRYNFRELLSLKVIAKLLEHGASVSALKKALLEFQREKWTADRANLGYGEQTIRYLVVSSGRIMFADSRNNFFELTNEGQMVFSFVVDFDRLHSELCTALDQTIMPFAKLSKSVAYSKSAA